MRRTWMVLFLVSLIVNIILLLMPHPTFQGQADITSVNISAHLPGPTLSNATMDIYEVTDLGRALERVTRTGHWKSKFTYACGELSEDRFFNTRTISSPVRLEKPLSLYKH